MSSAPPRRFHLTSDVQANLCGNLVGEVSAWTPATPARVAQTHALFPVEAARTRRSRAVFAPRVRASSPPTVPRAARIAVRPNRDTASSAISRLQAPGSDDMTLERITSRGRAPLKQARAPGDGPLDQAGRQVPFVRFEFPHDAKLAERLPKTFFSGHFDAHCPAWRMDDPALATDAFNEDVGFARLHYVMGVTDETGARLKSGAAHETATASLARPRSPTPAMADVTKHYHPVREYPYDPTTALERHLVPPSELERLQDDPVFARFKSKAILEESLNLEAFARHCMQLAPRCAHDFKPMCYLLQALLGHLLNREMSFWSEEVRELRNDLLRMRTLLDDAAQEHRIARASALLQKWRGKAKLSSARNNDAAAAMESHEHHILELTDKLTAEIDALKERCAKAEAKSGTQAALHKELKETKREKAKLEKELALAGKKAASEQKTLKTLCSQKDKTISELRRKVAELTETSDVTARMAAMAAEIEELKRRIEEGGGAAVENDDYEAFAKNLLAAEDTPEGRAERAKRFTNLSPHEAARVMQAMGDWSVAGEMLRRCTVDFTSDALTCGVLDPEDVGEALSNLSDMDGMVLFAMFRKMSHEAVAGVMRTVHPAIAGGWLANAADQAKSRMAVGGAVGVDALHDIVHTLGEQDVVAVLDAQRPEIVARLCEKMYYADELLDAVDALQGCSGATRRDALAAMDDVVSDALLEVMNRDASAEEEAMLDANVEEEEEEEPPPPLVFRKAVMDEDIPDEERTLERMTTPPAWLEYCGCAGPKRLFRMWEAENFKIISPIKLRAMLTTILHMKLRGDHQMREDGGHPVPIAEYVVDWFNNSYGFRNVAQRKLAVFAYSLQSVYEKKKDKRTCQFVRMCGLFHPMPNVMCELLLECTEIIAACMSGPGESYINEVEFWNTWTSGKMISVPKEKQLLTFERAFGGNHDAANLLSRLQDELEENPEVVPEYINLKPGSVSLSRYMEYTLKVVLELNLRSHDAVTREMKEAAGADKILDYGEFKHACEAIRPVRAITESSYAFIFWRALTMEKGATVSEVLSAAADPGAALEAAGGKTAGVSVDVGVESFLWHCGLFNAVGGGVDPKHLAAPES